MTPRRPLADRRPRAVWTQPFAAALAPQRVALLRAGEVRRSRLAGRAVPALQGQRMNNGRQPKNSSAPLTLVGCGDVMYSVPAVGVKSSCSYRNETQCDLSPSGTNIS